MAQILIIDDDPDSSHTLRCIIERMGHQCFLARDIIGALTRLSELHCDLIFLDTNLPDGDGFSHIEQFLSSPTQPEVVILIEEGDADGAALAIANGAWDYVSKPISLHNVQLLLQRTLTYRASKKQNTPRRAFKHCSIIGESPAIRTCLNAMNTVAASRSNVIVYGETGTGKELFARCIHKNGGNGGVLVVFDCASLPKHLAESTLFGHTKGSFTSAHKSRDGLFKLANRGTVFLDEIGELDLDLQKSLLRVLQEYKFRPVGSDNEVYSKFRVIAATNKDLRSMVEQGRFRSDLYYRLNGHTLHIPPLRKRVEDIQLLAEHYMENICREYGVPFKKIADDFLDVLKTYSWPGNVREFINAMVVAMDNAREGDALLSQHLPLDIRVSVVRETFRSRQDSLHPGLPGPAGMSAFTMTAPYARDKDLPSLREVRALVTGQMEKLYMHQLVQVCANDVRSACKRSGLSRTRFYELLKKHAITLK